MSTPLSEDVNYIRTLAEEGRNAPQIGGRILAWWSGLTAIAYTIQWAALSDRLPAFNLNYMWLGYIALGLAGMALLQRGLSTKPGARALPNRVSRAVWMSAGIGIGAYVVGVVAAVNLGAALIVFNTIAPAVLAIYGVALLTVASLANDQLSRIAGICALVFAAAAMALVTSAESYLVAAIGILLSATAPAIVQIAREPTA